MKLLFLSILGKPFGKTRLKKNDTEKKTKGFLFPLECVPAEMLHLIITKIHFISFARLRQTTSWIDPYILEYRSQIRVHVLNHVFHIQPYSYIGVRKESIVPMMDVEKYSLDLIKIGAKEQMVTVFVKNKSKPFVECLKMWRKGKFTWVNPDDVKITFAGFYFSLISVTRHNFSAHTINVFPPQTERVLALLQSAPKSCKTLVIIGYSVTDSARILQAANPTYNVFFKHLEAVPGVSFAEAFRHSSIQRMFLLPVHEDYKLPSGCLPSPEMLDFCTRKIKKFTLIYDQPSSDEVAIISENFVAQMQKWVSGVELYIDHYRILFKSLKQTNSLNWSSLIIKSPNFCRFGHASVNPTQIVALNQLMRSKPEENEIQGEYKLIKSQQKGLLIFMDAVFSNGFGTTFKIVKNWEDFLEFVALHYYLCPLDFSQLAYDRGVLWEFFDRLE